MCISVASGSAAGMAVLEGSIIAEVRHSTWAIRTFFLNTCRRRHRVYTNGGWRSHFSTGCTVVVVKILQIILFY